MDIASLITSFSTGTYTVTRTARHGIDRGRAEAGTTSTLTVTASVSPASGMDLTKVPEGRRTNGAITIFTSTELKIGGVGAAYEADRISALGSTWELSHVETWTDPRSGGLGYKCVAVNAS